jgi:hypothetical protein
MVNGSNAMAQAIRCQPLTMDAQVQTQASPWQTRVDKMALRQDFLEAYQLPTISNIHPTFNSHSFNYHQHYTI